jgi:hypothetical protein
VTLDDMYSEMELYGFDDFEDSQKLTLLNDAYLDIVTREPWPFLEKSVAFVAPNGVSQLTVNGEMRIRTADNVLDNSASLLDSTLYRVNSVLSFIDNKNSVVMTPERTDVVEKNYKVNNLNVYPDKYYFVGEDLSVYPAVSGDTNYRMYFLLTPVAATYTGSDSDSDTFLLPARHHTLIVYGALVKAFLVNDDPQATMFQNMFESRFQQMRADVWMNQYDRTERVHVLTDSYDWSY